jgi:hypothetical protein
MPDGEAEMAVVNHAVAVLWAIAALGTVSAPAASQEVNPLVRERLMVVQGPSDRRTDQIRVQVGINFFVPGPTNDGGDASKLREHARRAIYEMAGRECGLLLDTIAAECRLDSITVNLSRQGGQVEGFNAMGQLGFRITPK